MAIEFKKSEKKYEYEITRAMEEFADRKKPQKVFYENMKELLELKGDGKDQTQVISYYGYGGIGKSRLLRLLQDKLETAEDNNMYLHSKSVRFSFENATEDIDVLSQLAKKIENKYNYKFHIFRYALFFIGIKEGLNIEEPKFLGIHQNSELASQLYDLADLSDLIPVIGKFSSSFIRGIDSLQAYIKKRTVTNLEEIKKMHTLEANQIREKLPHYFSIDMNDNLKHEIAPFVFFLDTYEKLTNFHYESKDAKTNDHWISSPDIGFICKIPALYVIAGHSKLDWYKRDIDIYNVWKSDDALEQHLLETLDETDVNSYLTQVGISDGMIRGMILRQSHGIPMKLSLCAQYYYQQKGEYKIVEHDFLGSISDLATRIVGNLYGLEKTMIYTLVCFETWDDQEIAKNYTRFNVNDQHYMRVSKLSFIVNNEDEYTIHNEVREVLYEDMKKKNRLLYSLYYQFLNDMFLNESLDQSLKNKYCFQLVRMEIEMLEDKEKGYLSLSEIMKKFKSSYNDYLQREEYNHFKKVVDPLLSYAKNVGIIDETVVDLCILNADYHTRIGDYRKSEELLSTIDSFFCNQFNQGELFNYYVLLMLRTYIYLGEYSSAIEFIKSKVKVEKLGKTLNEIEIALCLSRIYFKLGLYDDAEVYCRICIGLCDDNDEFHFLKFRSIIFIRLGEIFLHKNLYDEALANFLESEGIAREIYEMQNSDASLNNLSVAVRMIGDAYQAKEQLEEALAKYEQYFEMKKALHSRQDNDWSLNNYSVSIKKIGDIHLSKGHFEEALNMYEQHYEIQRTIHEKQNSDWTLNNLAIAVRKIGDMFSSKNQNEKAIEWYEKSYKMHRQVYDNQNSVASMEALIKTLSKLGETHERESQFDKALDKYDEVRRLRSEINTSGD